MRHGIGYVPRLTWRATASCSSVCRAALECTAADSGSIVRWVQLMCFDTDLEHLGCGNRPASPPHSVLGVVRWLHGAVAWLPRHQRALTTLS